MKFNFSVSHKILKNSTQTFFHAKIENQSFRLNNGLRMNPKKFCRFLTPKDKSRTNMINPSIESSDFLFWYEKHFESNF